MKISKDIEIIDVKWNRNGISGLPFYSILFHWKKEDVNLYAAVFEQEGCCVVHLNHHQSCCMDSYDGFERVLREYLLEKGYLWD